MLKKNNFKNITDFSFTPGHQADAKRNVFQEITTITLITNNFAETD